MAGIKGGIAETGLKFGSAGCVEIHQPQPFASRMSFGEKNPAFVRKQLQTDRLTSSLFPDMLTGVRYWPYLLVARDVKDKKQENVETELTKIRKKLQKQLGSTSLRIGHSYSTFGPYKSMYIKHAESESPIFQFIEHQRCVFSGDLDFMSGQRQKRWKKALDESLPKAGRQYIKELSRVAVSNDEFTTYAVMLQTVINCLGSPRRYEKDLVDACICYAIFRGLYGQPDPEAAAEEPPVNQSISRLVESLRAMDRTVLSESQLQYVDLCISAENNTSPWSSVASKLKSESRKRIMPGFLLYTVANLYLRTQFHVGIQS